LWQHIRADAGSNPAWDIYIFVIFFIAALLNIDSILNEYTFLFPLAIGDFLCEARGHMIIGIGQRLEVIPYRILHTQSVTTHLIPDIITSLEAVALIDVHLLNA
jgi:hypothetical protein